MNSKNGVRPNITLTASVDNPEQYRKAFNLKYAKLRWNVGRDPTLDITYVLLHDSKLRRRTFEARKINLKRLQESIDAFKESGQMAAYPEHNYGLLGNILEKLINLISKLGQEQGLKEPIKMTFSLLLFEFMKIWNNIYTEYKLKLDNNVNELVKKFIKRRQEYEEGVLALYDSHIEEFFELQVAHTFVHCVSYC